ncbi:coiled-coil domain-containing protein 9B isoform X2 [Pungitius pungitius]|uniref:coiled-coil domain-containing protein 9B isoform X2 n=1 Tax=Pungitius pungitius TaxID=134920 RepID=UPI002E0FA6A3
MERPTTTDMMPKKDHERDVELDKKIEALRRKNEALMRRHKEVEEDRKRAEEEGMALQSRKGKAEDLTITISKSTSDARVVVTKPFGGDSKKGQQEAAGPDKVGDVPAQAAARGHRKQLTVTMAAKKGKRVVSERSERGPCPSDVQSPAGDGQVWRAEPAPTAARHAAEQDGVKPVQQHTEDHHRLSEQGQEAERLQASTDLDVPTSKEEQGEYARWKKERQQIDRERVARHKNAKGQWKRAWDMDKTENTSLDKSLPDRDWGALGRGGRSSRRGQSRAGHEKRGRDEGGRDEGGRDEGGRDVLVMSSKAKGIDRLTGRARRWQEIEDGANLQSLDTTLEEFLEVLGALTGGEADDQKDEGAKLKPSNSPDSLSASGEVIEPTAATQGKGSAPGPPGSERKVRFSTGHKQHGAGPRDAESRSVESFEANKQQHRVQRPRRRAESAGGEDVSAEDPGGGPSASGGDNGGEPPSAGPRSSAKPSPARPVGLAKCNANAGELIDSGLSVLVLDSGETHPTHSAGNDKAREHGKIV